MSEDPYHPSGTFRGRLRGKQVQGGSVHAELSVSEAGIQATPEFGQAHLIPIKGVRLRRDESGALIATEAGGDWSVTCDDPEFLRSMETVAGNLLNDQISKLEGHKVSSRGKHLFGCFLVLAFLALLIWSVPKLFKSAIDSSVEALPTSVDVSLGEAAQGAMDPGGEIIEDEVVVAAIQTMLDRLTPHAQLEGVEYQFRVVKNDMANAYALPGGFITVFTGLIEASESPEWVAGVIAHEIAHVSERHGLRKVAHKIGMVAGLSILMGNVGGLEKIIVELFAAQQDGWYSQNTENDADRVGTDMLIAAKINPKGLADFFRKLEQESPQYPELLQWASTHPVFADRIDAIENQVASRYELPEWEPLDLDWEAVKAAIE